MGGVVDAVAKPFKEIGGEIKKGVDAVGGVGQDIIDVSVKPARDIIKGGAELTKGTLSGATEITAGLSKGVGKLAQDPDALAAAAGVALGNPLAATSFLNRKGQGTPSTGQVTSGNIGGGGQTPQVNVSTTPPINAVQPNNFMMPLLIGAGALAFILLRRK